MVRFAYFKQQKKSLLEHISPATDSQAEVFFPTFSELEHSKSCQQA